LRGLTAIVIPVWLAIVVGTYGPAWAALAATALSSGKAGVIDLLRRLMRWRVGPQWYLIALLGPAAYMVAGIGLSVAAGGAMPTLRVLSLSPLQAGLVFAQSLGLVVLLNTEELVWRGVALPQLRARYSALVATLIWAVVEGLWHGPFFWAPGSSYQQVSLGWWMAWDVALAIVFTWVYNSTDGSLLLVTLLHAAGNTWEGLLAPPDRHVFAWTTGVLWVVALVLIAVMGSRNLAQVPRQTPESMTANSED
jgi:membrane protease YdiL (CAAX protease family)